MIAALAFVAGILLSCFLPEEFHRWVRGAVGGTRGQARAAPASTAKPSISVGKLVTGLATGAVNLTAFVVRNPVLCIGLILVAMWLILGSGCVRFPFGDLGKSRDTLRAELKEARANTELAEHEASVARKASELAEDTHEDRTRVRIAIARAEEEIEDAVEQDDFEALYRAYRAGYDGPGGVWFDIPAPDRSNPPAGGPAFVPGLASSPV